MCNHRSPAHLAVPSDPVVAARVKSIDAEGGNAFFQYQVPAAVITLKQGFGQLIRSLGRPRPARPLYDNRILKKQYGRVFVESLPNYRRTTDLAVVEEWFGRGTKTAGFLRNIAQSEWRLDVPARRQRRPHPPNREYGIPVVSDVNQLRSFIPAALAAFRSKVTVC